MLLVSPFSEYPQKNPYKDKARQMNRRTDATKCITFMLCDDMQSMMVEKIGQYTIPYW